MLVASTHTAAATPLDLTDPGVVSPSFRGSSLTTYSGWDAFDASDTPAASGFGRMLDDATPDLGTYAGTQARIVQDANLTYGHRSGSDNYYSGFRPFDIAGDTITVPTDGAVGSDGFTTIVLQVYALGGGAPGTPGSGNAIDDLTFDPIGGTQADVSYAVDAAGPGQGNGHYLVSYELPGNQVTYDLRFSSVGSSRAIDRIVVDTLYSQTAGAFDDVVLVPEPATLAPALLLLGLRRRRSH